MAISIPMVPYASNKGNGEKKKQLVADYFGLFLLLARVVN